MFYSANGKFNTSENFEQKIGGNIFKLDYKSSEDKTDDVWEHKIKKVK